MNTRFAFRFFTAVTLAATPLLNGCTQQTAGTSPTYLITSNPPPPPVVTQVVPATSTPEPPTAAPTNSAPAVASVPPLIITNAAAPLPTDEPVFPPNLRISKSLHEVIRLAQAGVEETVILTYITNSVAMFTLGAEEIVYLNDLGVPGPVITAMMQRDQTLKAAYASAAQPAPAVTNVETVAAAPTYVNPPPAAPAPAVQPIEVSDEYFYDTLTPYGTWVEVEGYGRCWRPTVAVNVPTWQPYRDRGRWVHTDAGWYWMSDYSWGSVAFHYGRWFSHPRWGWCWWPDRVWAPSWVTWRYDDDHCGWAPLPPNSVYTPGVGFTYFGRSVAASFDFGLHVGAFTFVPWNRFCDPYPYRHCLPRNRSVVIYNQTTVVNNVVNGNNNTVINRGIPKERVSERARTEVRTVSIREEKTRTVQPRSERFERDGRTLVVQRPTLAPAPALGAASTADKRPMRDAGSPRVAPTRIERPIAPPVAHTTPSITTPTAPARNDSPAVPDRSRRDPAGEIRTRENRPAVVRLPETGNRPTVTPTPVPPTTVAAPTPARTSTPIFSKPVVVERPAYTPSQQVVGGLPPESQSPSTPRSARPTSTWSSPTPQSPSSGSAPNFNNRGNPSTPSSPGRSRVVIESAPTRNDSPAPAPVFNRPNVEVRREESRRIESENRGSFNRSGSPTLITPSPRVIAPAPAPVINNPAPRPTLTPAPTPAPSAPRVETPRVETRPAAPARSESPRSESRPESGSRGR